MTLFLSLSSMHMTHQIDYIRRRQHISTIDTNSPSRVILASNNSSNQSFVPIPTGGMSFSNPMGGSGHTPYGYCTLRNGGLPSQSIATTVSMVSFTLLFQN